MHIQNSLRQKNIKANVKWVQNNPEIKKKKPTKNIAQY